MEVYREIKRDIAWLIIIAVIAMNILNAWDYGVDNTDKDGYNRSKKELLTDHGTGLQYLYKGGALIPRLDKNGRHVRAHDIIGK